MADPLVIAAAIAAVPASVAAFAALRVNSKVSTNGSKQDIGLLVELIHDKLEDHITDDSRHYVWDYPRDEC